MYNSCIINDIVIFFLAWILYLGGICFVSFWNLGVLQKLPKGEIISAFLCWHICGKMCFVLFCSDHDSFASFIEQEFVS